MKYLLILFLSVTCQAESYVGFVKWYELTYFTDYDYDTPILLELPISVERVRGKFYYRDEDCVRNSNIVFCESSLNTKYKCRFKHTVKLNLKKLTARVTSLYTCPKNYFFKVKLEGNLVRFRKN